jgi:hypothetical protein
VEGRRERRREVASPGVRSAERTSPIGSEFSEDSVEEGAFVDAGGDGEVGRESGAGFEWAGLSTSWFGWGVGGRQEERTIKIKHAPRRANPKGGKRRNIITLKSGRKT